uniref:Uncharacterized protein n=1 Tax=Eutreptiella gymnastica TaxID=73025 RepID=A0A7S4LI26_9EUGL
MTLQKESAQKGSPHEIHCSVCCVKDVAQALQGHAENLKAAGDVQREQGTACGNAIRYLHLSISTPNAQMHQVEERQGGRDLEADWYYGGPVRSSQAVPRWAGDRKATADPG